MCVSLFSRRWHGLHGFLKGLHPATQSVVEGSHVAHTLYYMRCLDKLDMTDTVFLKI